MILDEWPDPAGLGPAISNGMDAARKTRARDLRRAAGREARIKPLGPEASERVVALTLSEPPGETIHWTGALMAKAVGSSVSSEIDGDVLHLSTRTLDETRRCEQDRLAPLASCFPQRSNERTALLSACLAHDLFRGVWRLCRAGDRAKIRIRPRDRRHEAVASRCDSGHVPGSRLPVLKRPTQGGDMESQVALLDRDICQDSRHQPLLADNFADVFDKNDKNIERSSTQMNWAARLLKASLRWAQAKWTE